mmetsp:Transcript_29481/g.44629  ORF Transcript_29481/g.44629 Transcript_29481/m.44629 type:complete len:113 (+) Transcript_29481:240-578(+)
MRGLNLLHTSLPIIDPGICATNITNTDIDSCRAFIRRKTVKTVVAILKIVPPPFSGLNSIEIISHFKALYFDTQPKILPSDLQTDEKPIDTSDFSAGFFRKGPRLWKQKIQA